MTNQNIDVEINSLDFINNLMRQFDIYLIDNLEIAPYKKWSEKFAIDYWYTKYHLLADGQFYLNENIDDLHNLLKEHNLNINWLTVTDKKNFKIKVRDGDWSIEFKSNNTAILDLLTQILKKASR